MKFLIKTSLNEFCDNHYIMIINCKIMAFPHSHEMHFSHRSMKNYYKFLKQVKVYLYHRQNV